MDWGTILFVAIALLVAAALIFTIGLAMRSWVFELSPREWAFSMLLAFAGGVLLIAYVDGDAAAELLGGLVIFLAVVWWIYRLTQRREARRMARAGG